MDTLREHIEEHKIETIMLDELINSTNSFKQQNRIDDMEHKSNILREELKIINDNITNSFYVSTCSKSQAQKNFDKEMLRWLKDKRDDKQKELIELLEQIESETTALQLQNDETKNLVDNIMSGNWVKHLKEYSKKHNMKYGECMKSNECKMAYRANYGYNFTSPSKYIEVEEEPQVMEEVEEEVEQEEDKGNVVDTYNKFNIYDSQIEQLKQFTLSEINAKLEEMKKETAEARKELRKKDSYSDVRYLNSEIIENNKEMSNLLKYGIAKKLYKK